MTWDQWRDLAEILKALLIPAIAYVAWTVRDIRSQLQRMNGRTGRLEEWRANHEKALDDRFFSVDQRLTRVEDRDWPRNHRT